MYSILVSFLKRQRKIPVLAVLLILAGCATIEESPPSRDGVPLPNEFALPGSGALAPHWWRHFQDPRLDRIVDQALSGSFDLAAARSRLLQAQAAARVSGADRYPSLNATANASASRDETGTRKRYALGLAAAYEVDLWGRIDALAEVGRLQAQASGEDLRAARLSVTAEAGTTFYSLLRQRAVVDLLQQQKAVNARIADLIEVRVRNGQAQVDEWLRQQQLVESSQSELVAARADLARLRHQLAALTGLPSENLVLPEGHDPVSLPPLPAIGVPAQWLNRRPDLRAAWLRVQAADATLATSIAAQYPRIDLSASLETAATSPSGLFEDWIRQLAANLTLPLFRGGELEAAVDRDRAARAVAFNDFAQTVQDAVAEVETALSNSQYDRQRLDSLQRRLDLADKVTEQLRRRYLHGAGDYLDVLSALNTLQDIQRQHLEARWALVLDRIDLIRTIAGGWSAPAENQTPPSSGSSR